MAHSLADYPIFSPPFELPDRRQSMWSREDAELYFEWFMEIKDDRIAWAHEFLGLSPDLHGESKVVQLEQNIQRVAADDWKLNDGLAPRAYSVGADIGLTFADTVEREAGDKVWWDIVEFEETLDISYRLPALHGFPKDMVLDPLLIGTNTLGRLVADRRLMGLLTAYRTWMGFIQS